MEGQGVIKNLFSILLCTSTLVVGVTTSSISAGNRSRESNLDDLQRRCEQALRQNEHLRARNQQLEWALFSKEGVPEREREALVEKSVIYVDV